MKPVKQLILFTLSLLLLCSCAAVPSAPTAGSNKTEVILDNNYVIVADGDDTTRQAALCLQTALDRKMRLAALKIVSVDPGDKAIVLNTDAALEPGTYQFSLQRSSLHITASDSQVLLYAAKQLRQAMLDNSRSTKITADLCATLSGKIEQLPFTFISQNILFKNIEGGNTVNERAPRFEKLIHEYQPDILALQENSEDWIFHARNSFGKTYTASNQENVTFLFRADRYELKEKGFFYLSPTPDMRSQFEGDSGPRTCCWAIVTDKSTGKELFLCNAHLDWNNDTQRALQLEVMIEQLSPYFEKYTTIACGDYNSEPGGPIYARARELFQDSRISAANNISTVDHTCHSFGKASSIIDYTFHNNGLEANLYYILSDDYGGYVSDHYGVLTDFSFAE